MSKPIKFIIGIILFFLSLFVFLTEVHATKNYYSALKRKTSKVYYRIQRKPRPTVKLKVPFHRQEHSLSCEVAALQMVLSAKGLDISESEIMKQLPFQPMWGNPYKGFVGDINGKMLKTGYGVYWGPIADIIKHYRPAESFSWFSTAKLAQQIQNGNPVIVWGYVGKLRKKFWRAPDGTGIWGVLGEHTRVAIGFSGLVNNPKGFYLLDPIYGEVYFSSENLKANWAPFDYSGVIVY